MRVTFVALGWEQLGVSLLSSIAKQRGHEVRLAFSPSLFNDRAHLNIPFLARCFDDRKDVMTAIERQRPDVLAFSALTGTYQWMLGVAQDAKRLFPDVKVVFGGVHASAVPDRVLAQPQVDYVCVGEGDVAFAMILKAIGQRGTVAPIVNTRYKLRNGEIVRGPQAGFIEDLDSLPVFDKALWEEHIPLGDSYITMTSRGCPYRCTFCFNSFYAALPEEKAGRYVRQRSVEHMMHELRVAKSRYKLRMIEFFDDVFTLDKKWLKRFLSQYKAEIKVPFQCFTHVNYIDEDVARWLSEAGCFSSQIGVQSMNDEYKRKYIKRYERASDIERTICIMRKFKIHAKFDHMFGLPGEGIEAQETARKFYAETPPYSIQTYWTNYFPGTELLKQGLGLGLITARDVEKINDGLDCDIYSNSNSNISPEKMKAYQAYQIIFKLIPNLPGPIRKRLDPEFFARLPVGVCSVMSFMADVVIGLVKLSPDHILYAKYYLYHMGRFLLKKLGFKVPPATKRLEMRPPGLETLRTVPEEQEPVAVK
ncbi:MAG: cobalamin-dependent protein [Candidatus Omnitrophica bacterium]|nr:cobalamin-dependent protein [Candidatus Omnitrophota bacterium]